MKKGKHASINKVLEHLLNTHTHISNVLKKRSKKDVHMN